ncbi:MAG: hypothetical protein ACKO3W_05445, partial [bacterium]
NDYHFDTYGVGSLGLFLDLEGADTYPDGRGNDRVLVSPEAIVAPGSGSDGVFVDRVTPSTTPPSTTPPPPAADGAKGDVPPSRPSDKPSSR